MFYIDPLYIIFVLPAVIIAMIAQFNVSRAFGKYGAIPNSERLSGYSAARRILDSNGLYGVQIEKTAGKLSDHYDPRSNSVRLSESVYDSCSIGAVGIAAHETGHALQYSHSYAPMKLRAAIIPVTNIGSMAAFPLVLIGIMLGSPTVAYIGVAFFLFATLFQLITLPVEFNASARAMSELTRVTSLPRDELAGARKVLSAAAMTYIAALAVSLGSLIRLFLLAGRSQRRR
jgi:Zn-dependent membrane protease YugP